MNTINLADIHEADIIRCEWEYEGKHFSEEVQFFDGDFYHMDDGWEGREMFGQPLEGMTFYLVARFNH